VSDENTTVPMRQTGEFREPEILDGQTITLDGTNGEIVAITCRHLSEAQKTKLVSALESIRERLIVPNELGFDHAALDRTIGHAWFVTTDNEGLLAYTSSVPEVPLIILSDRQVLWDRPPALCVTLLHELCHLSNIMNRRTLERDEAQAYSKSEMMHDLFVILALGFYVPSDLEAIKSFPEETKEILDKWGYEEKRIQKGFSEEPRRNH